MAIIDSLGTIGHIKRIRNFPTLQDDNRLSAEEKCGCGFDWAKASVQSTNPREILQKSSFSEGLFRKKWCLFPEENRCKNIDPRWKKPYNISDCNAAAR